MVGGKDSPYTCPVCGDRSVLQSRRLGTEAVSVLECQLCAGLWLGHDSFEQLKERAATKGEALRGLARQPLKPVQQRATAAVSYRPCICCGQLMVRRQYIRGSGVVVDICRDHGIWFDDEELSQLLHWISQGGHHTPEPITAAPQVAPPSPPEQFFSRTPFDSAWDQTEDIEKLLDAMVRAFLR